MSRLSFLKRTSPVSTLWRRYRWNGRDAALSFTWAVMSALYLYVN
jgi:hypothetical protein